MALLTPSSTVRTTAPATGPAAGPTAGPTGLLIRVATHVAVGGALAWWATYFLWGMGGREPGVLTIAVALLGLSMIFVQPWRKLPLVALLLGNGIGVAAWTVVLTAPTGFAGAHEAASYTYAGQLGIVVLAWATTPARRAALVVVLLAAAGMQFTQGWLAWWGRQDPTELFQGTFYWHNQAGIFLATGALVAFTLVVAAQRPLTPLAWIVGPLCAAGTVFSTSRGSQLGLAVGVLLLLGLALRARGLRHGWLRLAGVVAASWAAATLLTGPPFFAERVAATASTAARSESFVGNGVQRFEDWRRALAIFAEWPVTGAGFYSYDSATMAVTEKRDGVSTAFAHNGFLQAASDGGLVLLVPLLGLIGAVLVVGGWTVSDSLRSGDVVQPGAFVTFVVLLLHSGMDFDWAYPGLLSLAALVGVLALPLAKPASPLRSESEPAGVALSRVPGRRAREAVVAGVRVQVLLATLAFALVLASAVGAWDGGLSLNASLPG